MSCNASKYKQLLSKCTSGKKLIFHEFCSSPKYNLKVETGDRFKIEEDDRKSEKTSDIKVRFLCRKIVSSFAILSAGNVIALNEYQQKCFYLHCNALVINRASHFN